MFPCTEYRTEHEQSPDKLELRFREKTSDHLTINVGSVKALNPASAFQTRDCREKVVMSGGGR